ncbi:MAG: hypothetical protein IH851_10140, partial [Armatimonadetes bacterium]|nr:hypothetical protein [Armatimonadota bacterium]
TSCRGSVPTLKGTISVEWRVVEGRFTYEIEAPEGIVVDDEVPEMQ